MFGRVLREPLVHFAALALVIFAAYRVLAPSAYESGDKDIVVTLPKIEQMANVFAKTWQRPPSPAELKELVDAYVKEEIYVREALLLGLDKDDAVIRRRLQLKLEFLTDLGVDQLSPTDTDLEGYLRAHPKKFEIDPLAGFQQLFLNPDRHGGNIEQDAHGIITSLKANPSLDPLTLGDATMLPFELPPTGAYGIAQIFGADFADAVSKTPAGVWTGPFASSFGMHIVRITERRAGRMPALAEVRDAVLREWKNEKRTQLSDFRINELLKRYKVMIEPAPPLTAKP